MRRILYVLLLLLAMVVLSLNSGCTLSVGSPPAPVVHAPSAEPGPPPWAPAHGHRAKHRYYYYPDSDVYFDPGRKLYFYFYGGNWQTSVTLPREFRISLGKHIYLDMDDDRPYRYHADVKKKYPPGRQKKEKGPKRK